MLKWTLKPPTKAGMYWTTSNDKNHDVNQRVIPVRVMSNPASTKVEAFYLGIWTDVKSKLLQDRLWAGPIEMPQNPAEIPLTEEITNADS